MSKKKLSRKIEKVLKEQGFVSDEVIKQDNNYFVDISQGTPLGEDWSCTLCYDGTESDFIDKMLGYCSSFDVDEEVAPLINARGTHGIPSSVVDLVEDAKWKQEQLEELADKLRDLWE